jgi:CO dehydrogenase maturation factor
LLGELSAEGRTLVADFDAGLGTVLRLGSAVDVVLVVAEPTPKSLEVAARAAAVVGERGLGRVLLVANRVRDAQDLERVRAALPGYEPFVVPDDPRVAAADREGRAPIDAVPDAPAVRALVTLATLVTRES